MEANAGLVSGSHTWKDQRGLIRRVRKSSPVVVQPSEPVTTTGIVNISSFDKHVVAMPVTSLLVFDNPVHEPAETIRRGLSQALVPYHPVAGRLATTCDDGQSQAAHIRCTGEGVAFVAASANCALKVISLVDQSLLEELAVYYSAEGCGDTDPLLLIQVTEFSCGGFIVGVTWNHGIADVAGMAQFLNAVGEVARGISRPSVAPVRAWDESLPGLPASNILANQSGVGVTVEPGRHFTFLDIAIPSSLISRIKEEYRSHNSGEPCTVFEAVTAVLWQCRTRAVMADHPDARNLLLFAVDARRNVGVKDGYYGNCVVVGMVAATCGAVADGGTMGVVKLIKRAKEEIPEQFRSDGDAGLPVPPAIGRRQLGGMSLDNLLVVSSWQNLGFDEVDFGGGRPSRVIGYVQQPSYACLPCKGKDGIYVLSCCVREEHADAFLGELARFT